MRAAAASASSAAASVAQGARAFTTGSACAGLVMADSAFACFVLMLMVMGNTQASYAPITMTLLFG